jgi:hopanoid biosynthesis associated RND transporter like protein HpnN
VIEPALAALARALTRRPGAVAAVAAVACLALGALGAARLELETARLALVGEAPFVSRHLALEAEFGDLNAIVAVLAGPNPRATREAAAELAAAVRADQVHFRGVFDRVAPEAFGGQALLLLEPDQLASLRRPLEQLAADLPRGAAVACVASVRGSLEARLAGESGADGGDGGAAPGEDSALLGLAEGLLADLTRAGRGEPPEGGPAGGLTELPGWDDAGFAWTGDGKRLILLVDYLEAPGALDARTDAVQALRDVATELQARTGVEVGLTGKPVLEVDEMRTYEADSLRASGVALAGVTLLLVIAFRRWLGPLLIGLGLALAVAATLGLTTLWPGHLNLMAVVFVVVVIGVGVDFGIHLAGRYDEARARGEEPERALALALTRTGPAIVAGAFTTVVAFLGALLTDFRGLQEFGAVAAFGVLASLLVMLTVLPALLLVLDRRRPPTPPQPGRALRWLEARVTRSPRAVLAAAGVLTLLALVGARQVRYESNLLLLQDPSLPSVQLELDLLRDPQVSGWFLAHATTDLAALREVTRRVAPLPGVARVESVLDLLPPDQEARLGPVRQLQAHLARACAAAPPPSEPAALASELERLEAALEEALDAALRSGREEALEPLERLLTACAEARDAVAPPKGDALAALDRAWGEELVRRGRALALPPAEPLTPATLPDELRARLVGSRGSYLLRIHPVADLWDPGAREAFLAEVRAVLPEVSGVPVLVHESSERMLNGYREAAVYAFVAVVACVLLLTRSPRGTLLATLSLGVGGLWTAGAMGALGIDLNPANLVALPMLLGVGVDTSVHVVHRLSHRNPGDPLLAASLGRALLYSGLTSAVGFGSLMLADHPGTASIGSTIGIGVLACLLAGLLVPGAVVGTLAGRVAPPKNLDGRPPPTSATLQA